MVQRISRDRKRFRNIVRGQVRDNLKKYISSKDLIAQHGNKRLRIPVREIRIPRFIFDPTDTGGVGQGKGEPGDIIGQGPGQPGAGQPGAGEGEAGDEAGEHDLEMEFTPKELAELLGERLELPRIEPKGDDRLHSSKARYTGISQTGPESLRHFRRTFRRGLLRQIASGTYNPEKPFIVPRKEDKRYRAMKQIPDPEANAVIFFVMDVSGSMGERQKELVRTTSFWIDLWIRSHYQNIESRYIIHDSTAVEVDRDTFYRTSVSGGTVISSAYKLLVNLFGKFPPANWNVYVFQFSDGDNWSSDDNEECIRLLRNEILPVANLFAYGQTTSSAGSGRYSSHLVVHIADDHENFVQTEIKDEDQILDAIKVFLGKGK